MIRIILALLVLAIVLTRPALTDELDCDTGPVLKNINGAIWLIYSCADEQTLLLLATGEKPANPYYFLLSPEGDGYRLYGEGKANAAYTEPVANYLRELNDAEILLLLDETREVLDAAD